jgi:tetratricopeptide (TPR) repeat protein
LRALLVALATVCVVSCAPRAGVAQPPPLDTSPASRWTYAAYLLARGDPTTARTYLEPVASGSLDGIIDPALFLRDLAEARLFSGDSTGAATAARQAAEALDRQPTTAQFRADDRAIFERTLDALAAAAADDTAQLQQLTTLEQPAPSADAWYLLGWVQEQHGDAASARKDYQRYLELSPQWSFLRETGAMRSHARDVTR